MHFEQLAQTGGKRTRPLGKEDFLDTAVHVLYLLDIS
jgi:hypothetical protein